MSEKKYTPGPWRYEPDEDIPGHKGPPRVVITDEVIGKHKRIFVDVAPMDANARLISAAPDLLEALEAVMDSHKTSNMSNGAIREAEEMARAAIAKAYGKEES